MISNVRVEVVKVKPVLKDPDYAYGIRDAKQARIWAEMKGYKVVYFWKSKCRCFAERKEKTDE